MEKKERRAACTRILRARGHDGPGCYFWDCQEDAFSDALTIECHCRERVVVTALELMQAFSSFDGIDRSADRGLASKYPAPELTMRAIQEAQVAAERIVGDAYRRQMEEMQRAVAKQQELMMTPQITVKVPKERQVDPRPTECGECKIVRRESGVGAMINYRHNACREYLADLVRREESELITQAANKAKRTAHGIVEGGESAVAKAKDHRGGRTIYCQNEDDIP